VKLADIATKVAAAFVIAAITKSGERRSAEHVARRSPTGEEWGDTSVREANVIVTSAADVTT
jgi:hypothetical protein